jgi:hypothetical protein
LRKAEEDAGLRRRVIMPETDVVSDSNGEKVLSFNQIPCVRIRYNKKTATALSSRAMFARLEERYEGEARPSEVAERLTGNYASGPLAAAINLARRGYSVRVGEDLAD